ncbi:MAG: hypothetical protein IKN49_01675 [Elusimicrobiaceae bacterium]|nr:hypothetical protein [Elusimicrobiaceae bacterium]
MRMISLILMSLLLAVETGAVVNAAPQKAFTTTDKQAEFWYAIEHNDTTHVRKLARKDKRLVYSFKKGMTPYLYSVKNGNRKMAWMLADEFWAHAYDRCSWGNAIHIAVENQDFPMLKLTMKVAQMDFNEDLLEQLINEQRHSAKPDQKRADLNTPLHIAALHCNREMYDYLVSFGANETKVNINFKTAAEILATCPKQPKEKK